MDFFFQLLFPGSNFFSTVRSRIVQFNGIIRDSTIDARLDGKLKILNRSKCPSLVKIKGVFW